MDAFRIPRISHFDRLRICATALARQNIDRKRDYANVEHKGSDAVEDDNLAPVTIGYAHIRRLECHAKRVGKIDEVPIIGRFSAGKFNPAAITPAAAVVII